MWPFSARRRSGTQYANYSGSGVALNCIANANIILYTLNCVREALCQLYYCFPWDLLIISWRRLLAQYTVSPSWIVLLSRLSSSEYPSRSGTESTPPTDQGRYLLGLVSFEARELRLRWLLTGKMVCLQNFYEYHIISPNVFNVMCHGFLNISTVSSVVVKGPRVALCGIDTDPSISCNEEIPFIACSVPVNLTHSARLDGYDGCREHACGGESRWIYDFDSSSRSLVSRTLFWEVICVRIFNGHNPCRANNVLFGDVHWCLCSREDK